MRIRANSKNFLRRCKEEIIISIKSPLRISVRSTPKPMNNTPIGILRTKNIPKNEIKRNPK